MSYFTLLHKVGFTLFCVFPHSTSFGKEPWALQMWEGYATATTYYGTLFYVSMLYKYHSIPGQNVVAPLTMLPKPWVDVYEKKKKKKKWRA